MPNRTSRQLLGSGALIALMLPLVLNFFMRPNLENVEYLRDLGAAGPFEALQDGQAGRPISAMPRGASFAWTYHYCLETGLPAHEIVELRRIIDGQIISRHSGSIDAGTDHCAKGTSVQKIPIDARPGLYELDRHVVIRMNHGAPVTEAMSAIPIEVTQ